MRRIDLPNIVPGMVIGRSLYNSLGQTLLKSGTMLSANYIRRLEMLGIPCLYIREPSLNLPEVKDVISDETRVTAMVRVRDILEDPSKETIALRTEGALSSVKDIVRELLRNSHAVVNLTDIRLDDDYLFAHSVNVCVLALLTCISLGYTQNKLHEVGLGALFHDVGKIMIPKPILNKPGSLSPEEYAIIKRHADHGYLLLKDIPIAKDIAYQHHERVDGTGYPQALTGGHILETSQIVAMADVFDALTAHRQYRVGFPAHEAYEYLSASGNKAFDMRLLRVFLKNIAAYPSGLTVELSDGSRAIVLDTAPGAPLYPRVRLLSTQSDIELKHSTLHIIKVLTGSESIAGN
ncbi:MAG: Cyclic di-GMP phosphodiesterase response regulator RpfG [Firmicutes bacterium]|nr:Cyclic di-GMP phosphodiesterase response regulator RpfG [Bacillota bacterium]